jgi:hypothetical protein
MPELRLSRRTSAYPTLIGYIRHALEGPNT